MKTAEEVALEIVREHLGDDVDTSCDCGWVFDIERAIQSAVAAARAEEREDRDRKWIDFIRLRWGDAEADAIAEQMRKAAK